MTISEIQARTFPHKTMCVEIWNRYFRLKKEQNEKVCQCFIWRERLTKFDTYKNGEPGIHLQCLFVEMEARFWYKLYHTTVFSRWLVSRLIKILDFCWEKKTLEHFCLKDKGGTKWKRHTFAFFTLISFDLYVLCLDIKFWRLNINTLTQYNIWIFL